MPENLNVISVVPDKDLGIVELLLKRQAELNSLLELTQAIIKNSPSPILYGMLKLIFSVHLNVKKMRLMIREEEKFNCVAKYGGAFENPEMFDLMHTQLKNVRKIEKLSTYTNDLVNGYDYFIPVLHENDLGAYVLIGNFETNSELVDNDLNFMQTLINVLVVAIENKKLFEGQLQRERMQRDMELASEVQNMMVPLRLPRDKFVEVGALYLPNQNIGGDYFDFIRLNDDEFLWCVADVSGKGISAALLMANLQATLRAWVSVEHDLVRVITKLNALVSYNTRGERFITLFLGKYNQTTREMQFVNAGHSPPVVLMGDDAILLKEGTTIIGAFDKLPFVNMGSLTLLPGTLIFSYTDGFIESADEDVFINEDELIRYLKRNQYLQVDELNASLLKDVQESYEAKMNSDDITLLSIKIF